MTALLLCVGCFAYVLVRFPNNFFADDSYFYFQVAWNFAHGRGSTFNVLMPTNGYHPLWMLVCAAVYLVVQAKDAALHAIACVISLLNLLTLAAVTVLLRRAGTSFPASAWLLLLPFLFTSQLGTEGALSAACLTVTLLAVYGFVQRPSPAMAAAFTLGAALTVLSRLDNIFIVATLSLSLTLSLFRSGQSRALRLLLAAAPLALLLWGFYLWTNHHDFGTWQPISGVIKSHGHADHRLGSNLPRTAIFDLAIIAAGVAVLAKVRRDLFFRTVELPFACGVLLHALYIVFRMSNETRWTWYYTTWTLLAAIVLARVLSGLLERWKRFHWPALAGCTVILLVLAARNLHAKGHDNPDQRDPGFQANAVDRAGLKTLLAFDKPGRIAYFSTARIIPLDGLMGDLHFQQDLAAVGVHELIRRYHVDGFIGPPQPMDEGGKREFCDQVFLSATRLGCVEVAPGRYEAHAAEVYARLSGTPAGVVILPPQDMVWSKAGYVAVWRIAP